MPGNIKDAERAAVIHSKECHATPGKSKYSGDPPYSRPSSTRTFLGAGSYRCAYRIRGVVYKVEHQWYNRSNCNATEFANSKKARELGIDIIPPVSQFRVRVPNYLGRVVAVKVNAMPYYPNPVSSYSGTGRNSYYSALDKALANTPLEHLTWDAGYSNIRCTKGGRLRLIDAASQC